MFSLLSKTWALFFGFALICLAHGLQGTLIGVRATFEGFTFISIGLVVAGYYVGYLSGSIVIPYFLNRVGHIRVFAALASLASIAILFHSVFVAPLSWFFIRILTGISIAGIYVIMESWLNFKSNNENRGKVLSIYMIITFSFLGFGQLLLNLSDPLKVDLFILVSILLSFSLLPILLSVSEEPEQGKINRLKFSELYIISPLGFVGAIVTGMAHSVILGYGAVYASSKNFSTLQISIFMLIVTSFGAFLQWPIGYISDRIDRRIILIATTFLAAAVCILIVGSSYISLIIFYVLVGVYAGMSLPMYSLTVAHTNDFLKQDEIIAASSSIAILVGIGSIFGPILSSLLMELIGADGFFIYLFIIHLCLGIFGIYRMSKRVKPTDLESQYSPLPRNISSAGMEMNPKIEVVEKD